MVKVEANLICPRCGSEVRLDCVSGIKGWFDTHWRASCSNQKKCKRDICSAGTKRAAIKRWSVPQGEKEIMNVVFKKHIHYVEMLLSPHGTAAPICEGERSEA